MKKFVLFCLTFITSQIFAQVEVKKDARVDDLVKLRVETDPETKQPVMDGYRVQLSFESDKSAIDEQRNQFVALYPNVDTYLEFKAPNYILQVGDFRTQIEAEKVKQELYQAFPMAFIIKTKINLPRIDL